MTIGSIVLDSAMAECGGEVTGTATWSVGDQRRRDTRLELRYRTEGRGDTDSAVVDTLSLGGNDQGSLAFSLSVPADGPVSVEGKLIRVLWQVFLTVDVPMGRDQNVSEPVTVFPKGGLTLWARQHAPPPDADPGAGR